MKMILRQMGRFWSSFGLAVAIMCCMSFNTFAGTTYDWKIPDNVRIVQKGAVDGVRTFASIQAAINSISDASATNRYLVKIMPGIYTEQISLATKPYVDLSGSGQESTIITYGGGTIIESGSTSTTIENLTLKNSGVRGYTLRPGAGPVIARNVTFQSVDGGEADAAIGPSGILSLYNCTITGVYYMGIDTNVSGDCLLLSNCTVDVTTHRYSPGLYIHKASIIDSTVSVKTDQGKNYAIMLGNSGANLEIINSKVSITALPQAA